MNNGNGRESRVQAALRREAAGLPVVASEDAVTAYLRSPQFHCSPVIVTDGRAIVLDLGSGSQALGEPLVNLPVDRFGDLVNRAMAEDGTAFAYGRWGEPRELYSNDLFDSEAGASAEKRSVHMGVDLFCAAGTPVCAPLDGRVHIKANNASELDYGPLLVLQHRTPGGESFYTLYGHLSSAGIAHVVAGQEVRAGERIATVGAPPENGNWPPHLHFQLILDLLGLGADFPGVAYPSQQSAWLALSPLPSMFFPECDPGLLDGRATV